MVKVPHTPADTVSAGTFQNAGTSHFQACHMGLCLQNPGPLPGFTGLASQLGTSYLHAKDRLYATQSSVMDLIEVTFVVALQLVACCNCVVLMTSAVTRVTRTAVAT